MKQIAAELERMGARHARTAGNPLAKILAAAALALAMLPDGAEAFTKSAEAKAACVQTAIDGQGHMLKGLPKGTDWTPDQQAKAMASTEAFQAAAQAGVKKCLTEADVFELGWFSFLEDFLDRCRFQQAPFTKSDKRVGRAADADLLNGATLWHRVDGGGDFLKRLMIEHPFHRGGDAARKRYEADLRTRSTAFCAEVLADFGPTGKRFSGLVKQ